MRDPEACHDLALAHLEARRIPEAVAAYREAAESGFDANICRAGLWTSWMLLGRFEQAWLQSRAIEASGVPDPHRLWDGEPFDGKRVMLRCLHGLGDTIQFIRYAPLIRRTATRLVVQAHPELVRILHCVSGIDEIVTWGEEPAWDSQVEVTELPRIFETTSETVPADVPYLHVGSTVKTSGRTRVGLIWNSSQWNLLRCVPFTMLKTALDSLGWNLFSLQFGPERLWLPPMRECEGDVLDTATDMLKLDLVITVDTLGAHLAGALGRPVWVLLPFEADWRWMLDRADSPWYPTMRLFRQPRPDDWSGALDELRHAARAF